MRQVSPHLPCSFVPPHLHCIVLELSSAYQAPLMGNACIRSVCKLRHTISAAKAQLYFWNAGKSLVDIWCCISPPTNCVHCKSDIRGQGLCQACLPGSFRGNWKKKKTAGGSSWRKYENLSNSN